MYSSHELNEFSPSRLDGIDINAEKWCRWSYCEFLKDAGMRINVPQLTIATAVVFCHKFFANHSHKQPENERFVIATACLFLAGKVEETPKALRDVVKTALFIKYQDDPKRYNKLINDRIFMEQQRDVILCAERSLLHTLGFHFHAEHPYKHLLRIVKQMSEEKVIPEKNARDLAQVAWNFANDSLRTLLCLQYTSLEVAHSVLFLASKFLSAKISVEKEWWETCTVRQSVREDISNQILDLYEQTGGSTISTIASRF